MSIMSCNKINKLLVVYRFPGKRYDVHNNVAYINDKIIMFFLKKLDFKVILMSCDR